MSFRDAVVAALREALGEDADAVGDLAALLTHPPKVEMGDLAFPCFPLAKIRRAAPPKIAAELAGAIEAGGEIASVTALGPYVNFFADPVAQLEALREGLADERFFASLGSDEPERVMIEFSQPNTHKVFHVGHLRNIVIGDALARILRARGHDVVAANYYGDFGVDVAKCLWWLRTHPELQPPEEGRAGWLAEAYVAANAALADAEGEAREKLTAEVREVLRGMEEEGSEIRALYRETRQWCLDEFASIYDHLDVHFDHDFFESELEAAGNAVVDEFLAKGVFVESQGAIISDLEDAGLPVALVRKSDGASLYLTWDLALAKRKFDEFGVQKSLYVVGADQTLHFQQLFATLERMGYQRAKDCRHVSYELVMLPGGKMSTRLGHAVFLSDLLRTVLEAIEAKMRAEERSERDAWTDEQWRATAETIAIACLKYGMLHVGNSRKVIFDIDEWTNPEGDTGAYLLYGLARIAGIRRKAAADVAPGPLAPDCGFGHEAERELLNHLLTFPKVVARVEASCDPSNLANWIYEGTRCFSRFYQHCPVLKAEPPLRAARLALVECTQAVLERALSLLGIRPVEAM
jgi:arginyl-tRNA synthetase